jgi:NAD-dependent dihydropyrimidine dehydrogenase PreA subunit
MIIDRYYCKGCMECLPYCSVGAIVEDRKMGQAAILEDECVECGVCYRARVCETNAIHPQPLEWPRTLRMEFSDPSAPYLSPVFEHRAVSRIQGDLKGMDRRQLLDREGEDLTISGRGTVEMKMNDVMGRFKRGRAGLAAEVGRPGVGTRFRDVQTIAMALAAAGVAFEPQNPLTDLMTDVQTGELREDILNEKVLSCIIEFEVALEDLAKILSEMKEVAQRIDTVFAVDVISVVEQDGSVPTVPIAESLGLQPSIAGKTNVGLGRPLASLD